MYIYIYSIYIYIYIANSYIIYQVVSNWYLTNHLINRVSHRASRRHALAGGNAAWDGRSRRSSSIPWSPPPEKFRAEMGRFKCDINGGSPYKFEISLFHLVSHTCWIFGEIGNAPVSVTPTIKIINYHLKYHLKYHEISWILRLSGRFSLPFPQKISRLQRCFLLGLGLGLALWPHLWGLGLLAPLGQSRLLLRRMCWY